MQRIRLKEVLENQETIQILKNLIGKISYKYSNQYNIEFEDIKQDVWSRILQVINNKNYTDDFIINNLGLFSRIANNYAIDRYRYYKKRYNTTISAELNTDLSVNTSNSSRISQQRAYSVSPNSTVILVDILETVRKKHSIDSIEYRYLIGMLAVSNLLDEVRHELSSDIYVEAFHVGKPRDVGKFMRPNNPLNPSDGTYRRTAAKVRDTLAKAGYSI